MKEKKKRCFISIDLPDEIKREIKKIQDLLPEFKGKKTEQENIHLTLKFLGEISEKEVEMTKEALNSVVMKKFNIKINKIGVFSKKFIRIIWVGIEEKGESRMLWKLQQDIDRKLSDLFSKEKRFMGHITIGRLKKVEDKIKFLEDLKKLKINLEFEVNRFKLKQSILKKECPEYSDLEVYDLD
tara:strand:+ start:328 stop:879 length:552 start_codon:yes stop_codon:yes gene_type:complete